MYRSLLKVSVVGAVALGFWMATPEAQAQRRGGWGGSGWGRGSPGISVGVGRGGVYVGPSYGRYGWDEYGYGRSGYGTGFYDRGWYGSSYGPRSYYYSSPGFYSYSYPSTRYYSAPAVTYSYPSTTFYESAPATTYESSRSAVDTARSRDTARIRVQVPDAGAQVWVNDAPTQQRGMERVFETPPLSAGRPNTYEIRAKWQDEDGRAMEQTRVVRLQPRAQEVISFGQAE